MKSRWLRGVCLVLVGLTLMGGCCGALAQEVDVENSVERLQVANFTLTIPDDWLSMPSKNGMPQYQFMEADGKMGKCAVVYKKVTAYLEELDTLGLLKEVCRAFGGEEPRVIPVNNRVVAMFDAIVDRKLAMSHGVFMDGMDVILVQVYIQEATDTVRQQEVVTELLGTLEAL